MNQFEKKYFKLHYLTLKYLTLLNLSNHVTKYFEYQNL